MCRPDVPGSACISSLELDARYWEGRGDDQRLAFCFQPRSGFPEIADVHQREEFRLAGHRERHIRPEGEDPVLVARVESEAASTRETDSGQIVRRELPLGVVGGAEDQPASEVGL